MISNKSIIKRIDKLDELISAQLTENYSKNAGLNISDKVSALSLGFLKKKTKTFPRANESEIEKHLIEILEDIDKSTGFNFKPEFIFIFDEIDKIEPQSNLSISEKEEGGQQKDKSELLFSPVNARKRLHAVNKLLSNLKYFISTAKAKFIFIAGRELFDASLADISDRRFFIGSIFHEVIYLESFLSDPSDGRESDITSMVEQYVCQFLIPEYYYIKSVELPSLAMYNEYLESTLFKDSDEKSEDKEPLVNKLKREKIIFSIQQFITYLTHISSGAPNKITSFFEQYIYKHNRKFYKSDEILVAGRSSKNLYLALGYHDQYKIGMINYLVKPIILSIKNVMKDYGDRLLVSASFLVNHLYKFHRYGFSWRNLEVTPEIIDINRTPEMRNFIAHVIQYLSSTQIEEIVSGLYNFKFSKKISQEIALLSKISEEASATFNFTLDESLALKHHYKNVLSTLNERYINNGHPNESSKYIHSIATIHMVLGDLHFYDEEYGEATTEYLDGLQYLRNIPVEEKTESLLILLVRNMLKLGLTFEKRHLYDPAFITYSELTSELIEFRDIKLEDLDKMVYKGEVINNKDLEFNESNNISKNRSNTEAENEFFMDENFPKKDEIFTPKIGKLYLKLTTFEGIRILYQSLLAKFQIIEKHNLGGITNIDITRMKDEFDFLVRTLHTDEKYLIKSDFWNKVADILYFKNTCIANDFSSLDEKTDSDDPIFCCKNKNDKTPNKQASNSNHDNSENISPCTSCRIYRESLKVFLKGFHPNYGANEIPTPEKEKAKNNGSKDDECKDKDLIRLLYMLKDKNFSTTRTNSFKTLASFLSDIGDVLLCCSNLKDKIDEKYLEEFLGFIINKNIGSMIEYIIGNELSSLELSLVYSYLSGKFYKKGNEIKMYSFQLSKVLYIFQYYVMVKEDAKHIINKSIVDIEQATVKKALKGLYSAYENIHLYELRKQEHILFKNKSAQKDYSMEICSITTDLDEFIYVFEDLKISCYSKDRGKVLAESFLANKVSPYSFNNNMYNRLIKLRYKAHLNAKIFNYLFHNQINNIEENDRYVSFIEKSFFSDFKIMNCFIENIKIKNSESNNSKNKGANQWKDIYRDLLNDNLNRWGSAELIEFLITDSIYCNLTIINILNTHGRSFAFSHSMIAFAHEKLMKWNNYYYLYTWVYDYLGINNNDSEKQKKINTLLSEVFKRIDTHQEDELKIIKQLKNKQGNQNLIKIQKTRLKKWIEYSRILDLKTNQYENNPIFKNEITNLLMAYFKSNNNNILVKERFPFFNNKTSKQHILSDNFHDEFILHIDCNYIRYMLNEEMKNLKLLNDENCDDKEKTYRNVNIYTEKDIKSIFFCLKVSVLVDVINFTENIQNIKLDNFSNLEETLLKLIDKENLAYLSRHYQCAKAKKEYYSALETHTQGKAYRNFLKNMYYLNDDFNDKQLHFSAAIERYLINTNVIRNKIEWLKLIMKDSGKYHHETYMKGDIS